MATQLVFCSKTNIPLTTTEIIANALDYRHENVIKLTRKYLTDIEVFGRVGFRIGDGQKLPQGGYAKTREIAFLTEQQATLLVCFMQNNEKVRKFKVALVKAFYDMKQQLAKQSQTYTPDQIAEIKDKAVKQGIAMGRKSPVSQEMYNEVLAMTAINAYVDKLQNKYVLIDRTHAQQMYDVLKWWNDHRKQFADMQSKASTVAKQLKSLASTCDLFAEVYSITNSLLLECLAPDTKVEL
ncbi:MAG: Rha family transcriptional regulator [Succinivibrio sp.]|nr:Rha family transcriptional regulator [Succinivibrio sp.]